MNINLLQENKHDTPEEERVDINTAPDIKPELDAAQYNINENENSILRKRLIDSVQCTEADEIDEQIYLKKAKLDTETQNTGKNLDPENDDEVFDEPLSNSVTELLTNENHEIDGQIFPKETSHSENVVDKIENKLENKNESSCKTLLNPGNLSGFDIDKDILELKIAIGDDKLSDTNCQNNPPDIINKNIDVNQLENELVFDIEKKDDIETQKNSDFESIKYLEESRSGNEILKSDEFSETEDLKKYDIETQKNSEFESIKNLGESRLENEILKGEEFSETEDLKKDDVETQKNSEFESIKNLGESRLENEILKGGEFSETEDCIKISDNFSRILDEESDKESCWNEFRLEPEINKLPTIENLGLPITEIHRAPSAEIVETAENENTPIITELIENNENCVSEIESTEITEPIIESTNFSEKSSNAAEKELQEIDRINKPGLEEKISDISVVTENRVEIPEINLGQMEICDETNQNHINNNAHGDKKDIEDGTSMSTSTGKTIKSRNVAKKKTFYLSSELQHVKKLVKRSKSISSSSISSSSDSDESNLKPVDRIRKASIKKVKLWQNSMIDLKNSKPPEVTQKMDGNETSISGTSSSQIEKISKDSDWKTKTADTNNLDKRSNELSSEFLEIFKPQIITKLTRFQLESLILQKVTESINSKCEISILKEQLEKMKKEQERSLEKFANLNKQIKHIQVVMTKYLETANRATPYQFPQPLKVTRTVGIQVRSGCGGQCLTNRSYANQDPVVIDLSPPSSPIPPTPAAQEVPERPLRMDAPVTSAAPTEDSTISIRNPDEQINAPSPPVSTSVIENGGSSDISNNQNQANVSIPANSSSSINPVPDIIDLTDGDTSGRSSSSLKNPVPPPVPINSSKRPPFTNDTSGLKNILTAPVRNNNSNPLPALNTPNSQDKTVINSNRSASERNPLSINSRPFFPVSDKTSNGGTVIGQLNNRQKFGNELYKKVQKLTQKAFKVTGMLLELPEEVIKLALASDIVLQTRVNQALTLINSKEPPSSPVRRNSQSAVNSTQQQVPARITNGSRMMRPQAPVKPFGRDGRLVVQTHPAPLPEVYTPRGAFNELVPTKPTIKIVKTAHGMVLSWTLNITDKHASIASYQLFSYQEKQNVPPDTQLWQMIGEVQALPLPMACTLTQFADNHRYYFAVRAVDIHSRIGLFSDFKSMPHDFRN